MILSREEKILIECNCHTHKMEIIREDIGENIPPEYYINLYYKSYYTKQRELRDTLWRRLKTAWHCLIDKDHKLEEFCLSEQNIRELVSSLQIISSR